MHTNCEHSDLLDTEQASTYLGLSRKTLERFRSEGTGPLYVKVGPGKRARVRYRMADILAWLDANVVNATTAQRAPQACTSEGL